jgi:hypothetical protein
MQFERKETSDLCIKLGFLFHFQLIILHLFGIDFIARSLVEKRLEVGRSDTCDTTDRLTEFVRSCHHRRMAGFSAVRQ